MKGTISVYRQWRKVYQDGLNVCCVQEECLNAGVGEGKLLHEPRPPNCRVEQQPAVACARDSITPHPMH
jgi:hypothetical protein